MKVLIEGLRKFTQEIYPNQKDLFEQLAKGQRPHTLFITCSDSRIAPNLVTQTQPGELFIVRNAGNIIPPYGSSHGGEEATIEYAVEVLGVQHVVVCGHSHCGAMAALGKLDSLKELPSVKSWLGHAEATRRRCYHGDKKPEPIEVVEDNVLVQIANLKTHPSVSRAINEGKLDVFGWVYHFETGNVSVYHPERKKFVPGIELSDSAKMDVRSLRV